MERIVQSQINGIKYKRNIIVVEDAIMMIMCKFLLENFLYSLSSVFIVIKCNFICFKSYWINPSFRFARLRECDLNLYQMIMLSNVTFHELFLRVSREGGGIQGVKSHSRREKAFKEGRGILGGKFSNFSKSFKKSKQIM